MKITDLAKIVSEEEGKKKEVNIAQIKEVLRVVNDILDGEFYKLVRRTKD